MLRAAVVRQIASLDDRPTPVVQRSGPFPRIVALGGGTGLPIVLRGLKPALFPRGRKQEASRNRDRLTAIVTVADDGGSSGRLRRAYGVLPPGDARNCLLALSDGDPKVSAIFGFRFNGDGGVGGHSLGNLILTALSRLEKDFCRAVDRAGRMLEIRGRVLPATVDDVVLGAEFDDGSRVAGESRIASARRPIRRVALRPGDARAQPRACEAIEVADLIVIGPGSLYTSLLPVLLVRDLADAIGRSRARVLVVMNLMSEPGETDSYTAADVLLALRRHAPGVPVHDLLLNSAPISPGRIRRYADRAAVPIPPDIDRLRTLGCRPVVRDLLGAGPKIRHDPRKLARAILELAAEPQR
jgi:uncharacterized cofD-like protein